METLTVSLPTEMRKWIDERVGSGHFVDEGEYIRDLIRHDQEQQNLSDRSSLSARQLNVNERYSDQAPDTNETQERSATMFSIYDPNRFSDVADKWGNRLWVFFNRQDIVEKMVFASDAQRPAVEAIGPEYLEQFGAEATANRVKQFAGALVKQVMERHGFKWESSGHPIRRDGPFSTGSRYVRIQR